jgi:hypothetical protein
VVYIGRRTQSATVGGKPTKLDGAGEGSGSPEALMRSELGLIERMSGLTATISPSMRLRSCAASSRTRCGPSRSFLLVSANASDKH